MLSKFAAVSGAALVGNRIRSLRGGVLNDPNHHSRMRGEGPWADQIRQIFKVTTARLGLNERNYQSTTAHFRQPIAAGDQLGLFESN